VADVGQVSRCQGVSVTADITAAKSLVGGNPFLDDGSANFAVEIYELGTM